MTVRLHRQVMHIQTGDRHLLLDERDGAYYALNPAAAALISQLTTGTTATELAATLVTRYRVEPEQARSDVAALLTGLRTDGLTEHGSEHGPEQDTAREGGW
jgi:hypothetical protein